MKKVLLPALAVILILLTAIGSFGFGVKTERQQLNKVLYSTQAMLWFNHLLTFREIEGLLARGCAVEGLEATRIEIDQEMRLLSEFHKNSGDTSIDKYISDRDPKLLSELDTFKGKYVGTWAKPRCNK
jgi:hypothetical protein